MFSHKLSIPSSNTLSNANAPITIVTANVEVRRNKALYTVLPTLILALESSRNSRSPASPRKMAAACLYVAKDDGQITKLQSLMGFVRHLRAKFTSSSRYFYTIHVSPTRNRMSTMLSNVSLDHDEDMAVQEATTFRFSEEPSLEKM